MRSMEAYYSKTYGKLSLRELKLHSGEAEANADRFEQKGFEYTGNSTFGVFHDYWENVDATDLDNERFLEEVAERYAELVTLGHEVFTDLT